MSVELLWLRFCVLQAYENQTPAAPTDLQMRHCRAQDYYLRLLGLHHRQDVILSDAHCVV